MIVTITNQKGGVGKTTTAHALCTGLCNRGFHVLAVDADPQTNFTFTAGIDQQQLEADLYDAMKEQVSSLQVIQRSPQGFDVLPGSLNLAGADMEFTQAGREYRLKEVIEPVKEKYDFIIIDTPPTLGILTVNALTASDCIIVPMCADVYSIQGFSQLQGMIENVKKYCNHELTVAGVLLSMYDPRTTIDKDIREALEGIAAKLNTKVYRQTIRRAVAVKNNQIAQGDLFREYPKARVTSDFSAFIDEFLKEV